MNNIPTLVGGFAVYGGRDGDDSFEQRIALDELDFSDLEFTQTLCELGCKALTHLTGACRFTPLPSVVGAAEFMKVVKAYGAGGSGRFKVSKDDIAEAVQFIKDLQNLGATQKWEESKGVKATVEEIAPMFTAKRAAKAKADAEAKAAERKAMLGID